MAFAADSTNRDLCFTVDVEPDCPPFLWTWQGITEGLPRLLALLHSLGVPGTFFTTGASAETHPGAVEAILNGGHELACHGYSHRNFRDMSVDEAEEEVGRTNLILRRHAPVTAFRAPYLSFPEALVPRLSAHGFTIDSSRGAYKWNEPRNTDPSSPLRLEASVTSSVLRIPRVVRNPWFARLTGPVTLFVHPWEFVDLTRSGIRYDCRFRTGDAALARLRTTLEWFLTRGYRPRLVREMEPTLRAAATAS